MSGDETRLVSARCVLDGCGRMFQYDPRDLKASSFPFCSRRCQGVDLGNWVDETYRIDGGDPDELDAELAEEAPPVIEPDLDQQD